MRPLRVLFINSIRMWGGAEVWLMDVMRGLEQRGHHVTLVCRPDTILETNAKAAGFDVVPLAMRGDFDPVVVWRVMRLMRRKRIQVLSTNMDKELRFGGAAAKLAGNVAVIPSKEVDYPLKNKIRYRFTYNVLADYILANSSSTKNTLIASAPWLDPDRIEVVYKGIDPAPYVTRPEEGAVLRRELGFADDKLIVGFVGQIIERKGIPDIVECIPNVVRRLPNTRFLFVGEGMLGDYLRSRSEELGVSKHIVCTGFRKDIPAVMKAIDLLILPSVVEGFGYVLVEAMAAAKPTVATNVSSIPEIVTHAKTGMLVDVHEPKQMADAIVTVLRDEKLRRSMGAEGRKVVHDRFTLDRMISHIESIFVTKVYG